MAPTLRGRDGAGRTDIRPRSVARTTRDQALSQISIREITMPYLPASLSPPSSPPRLAVLHETGAIVMGRVDAPGTVLFNLTLVSRSCCTAAVGKAALNRSPTIRSSNRHAAGLIRRTSHTITTWTTCCATSRRSAPAATASTTRRDAEDHLHRRLPLRPAPVRSRSDQRPGLKQGLPTWRVDEIGRLVADHAAQISAKLGARVRLTKEIPE